MPEKNRKDWTPFGVVKPGKHNGWSNAECCDLVEISHVTHNRLAADILDCGMIRAGLVYDKSILNRHRILVNWLSPNNWGNVGGSRYGNASFEFNWPALLDGMKCFWVGSMDYSPIAVRILLSKQDHSEFLKPYDAKSGTGPWWYDVATRTHYWNGKYCLEVMLERDLDLDELLTLGAVKHHEKRCNISPGTCPDGGDTSSKGMARLIAMLVAQGITPARSTVFRTDSGEPTQVMSEASALALISRPHNLSLAGNVKVTDGVASALARAILAAYGRRDDQERMHLVKLFASQDDAMTACRVLVESHFELTPGSIETAWS